MEVEEATARHRMAPIDMYMADPAPREDIHITPRIHCPNFSTTSLARILKPFRATKPRTDSIRAGTAYGRSGSTGTDRGGRIFARSVRIVIKSEFWD